MSPPLVIAIDGPAGAGKSTVARAVARRLRIGYLDTGAMYRAVAAAALDRGVDPADADSLAVIAEGLELRFDEVGMSVDGAPAGAELRTPAVDDIVSTVSAHPGVRAAMVRAQRSIMDAGPIVAEGRDIGTVVYPDAPVKIFLVASIDERARRRGADLAAAGHPVDARDLADQLSRRDATDAGRDHSPLFAAPDAVELDTTELSVDEVVERVVALARGVQARGSD